MKKHFITLAVTSLILVYIVIFAGALVRMTGSGMGCPDWPKCFGHYIPPTEVEDILWQPNKAFKKGQIIIHEESLWVAKENFTTTESYDEDHWNKYTKHDYAEFNPGHTWMEYINRLCGAVAGLACFAMAIASFVYWKKQKKIVLLSWLVVFFMGFQAWLGATVVYSVLNPLKITIHMVMALVILALIIYIIHTTKVKKTDIKKYNYSFCSFIWIALAFTLIQIVLGTQIRELIDMQVNAGIKNEYLWLNNPNWQFYMHRSFSFLVLFLNLYLFYINRRNDLGFNKMKWVMVLLILEIFTGVIMYYLYFPFGTQTAHLVFATLLFGLQFQLVLESKKCYYVGK